MKHEHLLGHINKHRAGTVKVWNAECVHANVFVKEKVIMQEDFNARLISNKSGCGCGCGCVCASFCTVCWFTNALMHRYQCASLCMCVYVCVCVFLGECVLSELYATSSIYTPPKCSTCL